MTLNARFPKTQDLAASEEFPGGGTPQAAMDYPKPFITQQCVAVNPKQAAGLSNVVPAIPFHDRFHVYHSPISFAGTDHPHLY